MAKKEFDIMVFIGRFQPYHIEHHKIVKYALEKSRFVVMIIGSADKAPDIRNPLSVRQRISIMERALHNDEELSTENIDQVYYVPQVDYTYNMDRWIAGVQSNVNAVAQMIRKSNDLSEIPRIGIIGYNKDHTSFYLKAFPSYVTVNYYAENLHINATTIREHYFEGGNSGIFITNYCAPGTENLLERFFSKEEIPNLHEEYRVIKDYKQGWQSSPYPVTFNTVDAIVRQSGHILLIKRKCHPGKGHWALPGGFVNNAETLETAALRELKEETKIAVPIPVLKGSIQNIRTFDDPERSVRGRTITTVYDFKLNDMETLPKIKGSDDAEKAKWFPYSEFANMRNQIYEDHFCIVSAMIGL